MTDTPSHVALNHVSRHDGERVGDRPALETQLSIAIHQLKCLTTVSTHRQNFKEGVSCSQYSGAAEAAAHELQDSILVLLKVDHPPTVSSQP